MTLHKPERRAIPRQSLILPLTMTLFLLGGAFGLYRLSAQHANAQELPPPAQPPREIAQMLVDLTDLDYLNVLNKLKLKPEQLEKIHDILGETDLEFNRQDVAQSVPLLRPHVKTVRAAKQKALKGEEAAPNEGVVKGLRMVQTQRANLQNTMLGKLGTDIRALLNDEQIAEGAKYAKAEWQKANAGKSAKGSNAQWFNYYVRRIFVEYPRIQILLREMKAAREVEGGGENPPPQDNEKQEDNGDGG